MKRFNLFLALFKVKPVVIDGALAVIIGVLDCVLASMSNEEAYKYWNPYALYYTKFVLAPMCAGFVTLNFFRSKSYSDHRKEQDVKKALAEGNSTITTQITETKTNETQTTPPSVNPVAPVPLAGSN